MTSSVPSFVSPPNILMLNSFVAFANPVAKFSIFVFVYLFGIVSETIPKLGSTPFAAKSLTHEIILFLAASSSLVPDGISVLSTSVSTLITTYFFPILKNSTSSGINFLLPNLS